MNTNETAIRLAVTELLKYLLLNKERIDAMLNYPPIKSEDLGSSVEENITELAENGKCPS